jgi:hypothetical protein
MGKLGDGGLIEGVDGTGRVVALIWGAGAQSWDGGDAFSVAPRLGVSLKRTFDAWGKMPRDEALKWVIERYEFERYSSSRDGWETEGLMRWDLTVTDRYVAHILYDLRY